MTCRLIIKLSLIVAALFLAIQNAPLYAREGTVKVGVYDNAPIVFQDEEGNFRGLSVEVLEHIASKENWGLEYVFGTWPECLARLEKGQIDIQVYIAYSKERARKYDFTHEPLLSNWGTIYTWPGSGIETIFDLKGKTVALLSKAIHATAFKKLIKDFGIQLNIMDVDNHSAGFRLVEEKKADAVVVNRVFGLTNAKNYNIEKTNIVFNPIEIRYAMPKDKNRDLGIAIDKHIKLLKADKDSIFYKSFNKAFRLGKAFIPDWIKWLLATGAGVFCLLFGINILLKSQVKKRTRELESEILERKQAENKLIKNQYYLTKSQEIGIIGTWELDIQKNILIWTDENYKIFGVPLGTEMNYEIFLNCIHPDDRDYVHEKWSAGLNKEPYDIEHRIIVDDKVKWVREKADIEFDTEGYPIMAIGFTQEITERKWAEEKLKEGEKKYYDMIQNLMEGFYNTTLEGKLLDYNSEFVRILGLNPNKDHAGIELPDFWQDPEDRKDYIEELMRNGLIKNYIANAKKSDGEKNVVQINSRLIKDKEGRPSRIEGTFLDITERQQAEAELEKYKRHLEELVRERTAELEEKNTELERMNDLFVGREFRIKELRDRVEKLEESK